jgi:hypothetical protein
VVSLVARRDGEAAQQFGERKRSGERKNPAR